MNLKELSQILSLSQTTVSRALNGYPEVNESTRQRVVEAAREHGYAPNAAARRLATGKANAIGCVILIDNGGLDPQFLEFLAGVNEQAAKEKLDVVLASTDANGDEAAFRRLASHGQVDGIFLFAPGRSDPRIKLLEELDLPFIIYGGTPTSDTAFPHLDIDNDAAFNNAARLLTQMGHKRIALLNGVRSHAASAQREKGARRAMKAAKGDLPKTMVQHGDLSEVNGYEAAGKLLDGDQPPTALLCASLFAAMGAERAAVERGVEVGSGLSLIAHDDGFPYLKPETFRTPLTTTRAPLRKAGMRVAERLNARIKGTEKDPKAEIWPAELVLRASVGPPA